MKQGSNFFLNWLNENPESRFVGACQFVHNGNLHFADAHCVIVKVNGKGYLAA